MQEGLPLIQNILSPSTHYSDKLSSSVGHFMRRCPIRPPPPAYRARRSPHIGPANRIRSDGQPPRIWFYKVCSNDGGLWFWDATTKAASDNAASQRRGWRGVLSFFFEVGACQGRVTLSQKSLRGVGASNNSLCLFYNIRPSQAAHSTGKNHLHLPVHQSKTFLYYSTSPRPGNSGFSV